MNDNLSSRDACMQVLREAVSYDPFAVKFALWAACELMDLGTLNNLVETMEDQADAAERQPRARQLRVVVEERFPPRP
jgi:abortive infection bacteriophage resistance protein